MCSSTCLDADWLKCSQSYVERDFCGLDAAVAETGENLRGEVEAGGGSGYGSTLAGVDGLIAIAVGGGIVAGDVGRERDVADPFHAGEEIVDGSEAYLALAEFAAGDDLGMKFVMIAEEKMFADSDLSAGPDQTFPLVGIALQLPGKQDFDTAAKEIVRGRICGLRGCGLKATTASVEARGKDAGVIEDEKVAGPEKVGEITKLAVVESAGRRRTGGGDARRRDRAAAAGRSILQEDRSGNRKRAPSSIIRKKAGTARVSRRPQDRFSIQILDCFGHSCTDTMRLPDVRPAFYQLPHKVFMPTERKYREEIVRYGRMLHERGFVAAMDGNLSVRLKGNRILVTPTCLSKGVDAAGGYGHRRLGRAARFGAPECDERDRDASADLSHAARRAGDRACASADRDGICCGRNRA